MPPEKKNSDSDTAPAGEFGFLREPAVLSIIPVSRSAWWKGIADGRFPTPVRLGPRTVGWLVSDIRALAERLTRESQGSSRG